MFVFKSIKSFHRIRKNFVNKMFPLSFKSKIELFEKFLDFSVFDYLKKLNLYSSGISSVFLIFLYVISFFD